ncbi:hypothetical protein [Streptomyces sp. NPDC059168]|uniref:hypothetical protein n=1 Tax=Streptomyces sp. NPDC059168 TaxID=3346753 RepID=UPI00368087DA
MSRAGWVVGGWRLLGLAGRDGGVGHWLAEDVVTRRPLWVTEVALTVPAGDGVWRAVARVEEEAAALYAAEPGTFARLLGVTAQADAVWIGEERPAGRPLSEFLGRFPMRAEDAAHIVLKVLDALSRMHRAGIRCGFLTTRQVWVRHDGGVVLSGTGIGTLMGAGCVAPLPAAPEWVGEGAGGEPADLWAVGRLLAVLLGVRVEQHGNRVCLTGRPGPSGHRDVTDPAGPLTPAVRGLLRPDVETRLSEVIVRRSLMRVLHEDRYAEPPPAADPLPAPERHPAAPSTARPGRQRSAVADACAAGMLFAALLCVLVLVLILATPRMAPDTRDSARPSLATPHAATAPRGPGAG